jgi:hypothetical protein
LRSKIDDIVPPAKALLIRGVANLEIVEARGARVDRCSDEISHGDKLAAFEAQVRALNKQMARITIAPTWARFYSFGAGRFPTFLRRFHFRLSGPQPGFLDQREPPATRRPT